MRSQTIRTWVDDSRRQVPSVYVMKSFLIIIDVNKRVRRITGRGSFDPILKRI